MSMDSNMVTNKVDTRQSLWQTIWFQWEGRQDLVWKQGRCTGKPLSSYLVSVVRTLVWIKVISKVGH